MTHIPLVTPTLDWVPFYEEFADKLPEFRGRQWELIAFLEELRGLGLTITPLMDRDEGGEPSLLTEIDPFTFYGCFNRGIVAATRTQILEAIRGRFGVQAPAPLDFSGIPLLNAKSSWFFAKRAQRQRDDIERLWDVFVRALGENPMEDEEFARAFDRALKVRQTNVNLTMGLFWIRPRRFLGVDGTNREALGIKLPAAGLNFDFYRATLARVIKECGSDLVMVSHLAYVGEPATTTTPQDVDYWMVGAYWDDREPADQTARFLDDSTWENGWKDRFLDDVRAMKVGDKIAIKAARTQKHGLPFDARGHTVSCMVIKATGTIVSNSMDGQSVEVEWDQDAPIERAWYFYTYRPTVWRLRRESHYAQHLIRFCFQGQAQDYEYFLSRWWSEEPGGKGDDPPTGLEEAAEPYSVEDLISDGVFLSADQIAQALRRLRTKKNLILQGAPGVGKTFVAKKLAYALMEAKDDSRVAMVQFHPSFSYEDFVRGYRPTTEAGRFELKDGPFVDICRRATEDPDHRYVLIVDEINRGNLGQAFGELLMLLEADKRGAAFAITPLYPRMAGERFFVPSNLYLIATMNIADRSLALVDYALRRRFAFVTLEPQFDSAMYRKWLLDREMAPALVERIVGCMGKLNVKIADDPQLGAAFRIGHSFFCPSGPNFAGLDEQWYEEVVETEILPLVEEYWHDDADKAGEAKGLV